MARRKKALSREQAINKLKETKRLTTNLLEPLNIEFGTFLSFAQLGEDEQADLIEKLIKMLGKTTT